MLVLAAALAAIIAAPRSAMPAAVEGAAAVGTTTLVMSDGATLHYLESGSRDASPILLVPGWTMPAWIWEGQLRRLGARHRVIALDPRAQGESPYTMGMDLSPVRRSRDVAETLDALHLERALVVGWSLGAVEVARCAAGLAPGRVAGVVLIDQPLYDDPARRGARDRFRRQLRADREAITASFVRGMFRRPQSPGFLDRLTRASLATPLEASLVLLGGEPGDLAAWCEGIRAPVLWIATPTYRAQAERARKANPGIRTEVLAGCGHALFIDAPDRFSALLESFAGGGAR